MNFTNGDGSCHTTVSCARISTRVGIIHNSIEMMNGGRCGRRKQRNPRRTNMETGTDGEGDGEEAKLDDNKNKIINAHSPSISDHGDGYYSDQNEAETSESTVSCKDGIQKSLSEKLLTPEEKVAAILKEIQLIAPDSTSDGGKVAPSSSSNIVNKAKTRHPEDVKIAELLNRVDTAVIYPEPVSDGDDQQNCYGGLSDEEILLKCMHCPHTFQRAILLRDHMREDHADKPLKFMCPKCDETFHQKSQLDKHLTLHSPTSQVCSVCNKTFANVYRLQRHMISHNESTDLRKFKCPECGKAFKFKHHLKEHVRIHSGEKPFVCHNCGKRFSHSGSFSSHTTSKKCWGFSTTKGRVGDIVQTSNQNVSQVGSQGIGSYSPKSMSTKLIRFPRSPHQTVPVTISHQQHALHQSCNQQKELPSLYFHQQMYTSPDGFLHPMYSAHLPQAFGVANLANMKQHANEISRDRTSQSTHHSLSSMSSADRSTQSMSPHSQSTRSFSPFSHSDRSVSPASVFSMSSPPPPTPSHINTVAVDNIKKKCTPKSEFSSTSSSHSEQISPDVNSNTKILLSRSEENLKASPDSTKEVEDNTEEYKSKLKMFKQNSNTKTIELSSEEERNFDLEIADETNIVEKHHEEEDGTEKCMKPTIACQYCGEIFESSVAQHQHECYLCKHNTATDKHRTPLETGQSPHSLVSDMSHVESTINGSVGNESDGEEIEEIYKDADTSYDERCMRIRTQFTEDQQSYLKSQYIINPRPRKFELIRMGNKIGFSKRVVQVWFQNMRARERKFGHEPAFSFSVQKCQEMEISKLPNYIPNVPKLYPTVLPVISQCTNPISNMSGQLCKTELTDETPLDLSVRKSPPLAHGGGGSRLSTPDDSKDDQALNLTKRRNGSANLEKSVDSEKVCEKSEAYKQCLQKSFQDSPIFKYMQQEGMFMMNKQHCLSGALSPSVGQHYHLNGTLSPSLALSMQNQLLQQTMATVLSMPSYKSSMELNIPKTSCISSNLSEPKDDQQDHTNLTSSSLLHSFALCQSPIVTALTNSGNSTNDHIHEDMHNLATLAEAAQQAATVLAGKPKRLCKKTWRQMEAEEVSLKFEDSASSDDDEQPLKKKRKSWKSHHLDREEGLYACDQCNKVFSKQSSLARHKYEHSGARPFACDLCTKSFKHKHHLTEHKRLHSGEKPFQCKKCGKRFSHSGSFSQHMNHRYHYCSPHKTSDGDGDGDMSSQESP